MKKLSILLVTGIISCWVLGVSAQSRMVITENFDGNTNTFTSTPTSAWKIDSNYYVSSHNSIRGIVPNKPGDSTILLSDIYNLSNYRHVLLRFSHICKISPQDTVRIEYRISGQGWEIIPDEDYLGKAKNQLGEYVFNANSYSEWKAEDNLALPSQSWWKEEVFDVGSDVGTDVGVQFRFILKHGNTSGTQISYGWLIDNIEIIADTQEIKLPVADFITPLVQGIVYSVGPWEINAKVKTQTSAPIKNPWLIYTATNNQGTVKDSILMTMVMGDSLWKAPIPQFIPGTEVVYFITGSDTNGNTTRITSGYVIEKPNHIYGNISAALDTIISPVYAQVIGNTTVPVEVMLRNKGDSALTSASIHRSINGVITSYPWTGNLSWDFEQKVSLGNYQPRMEGYDTIIVWVSMPNGIPDIDLTNDTQRVITYGCSANMSGLYTVGQGEIFSSIKEALTILNNCPPVNNITFALKSGVYVENWDLSNINSDLMGNHTLTIISLAGNRDSVILRPASGVGIVLNNTDNIKIENITVDVSLTGPTHGIQFTGSCTNVVINQCNILGKLTGNGLANAYVPVYKTSSTGYLINMRITNCTVQGGHYGIHINGTNNNYYCQNITIDSNIVTGQYFHGISIYYTNLNSVSYNQVMPRTSNEGATWYGLYFSYAYHGRNIIGNKIRSNHSTTTTTLYGIYISYMDSALVANNEIYFLTSKLAYGMYLFYSGGVDYLHNTVVLTTTANIALWPAYIYVSRSPSHNATYKNNIFIANGAGSASQTYAIFLSGTVDTTFAQYNHLGYNNYYSSGDLGYAGVARANLDVWKEIIPSDTHSVTKLPDFVDITKNLELQDYASLYCNPIPVLNTDIRNTVRKTPTVMGCYEEVALNVNGSLSEILGAKEGSTAGQSDSIKVVFINKGQTALTSVNLGWSINGTNQTPVSHTFNPSLTNLQSDTVYLGKPVYTSGNFEVKVWINSLEGGALSDQYLLNDTISASVYICSSPLTGVISIGESGAFSDITTALKVISICGTGDITLLLDSGVYEENCDFSNINRYKTGNKLTLTSKTGKAEDVVIKPVYGVAITLSKTRNLVLKAITVDGNISNASIIVFTDACTNITIRDCRLLLDTVALPSSACNHIYKVSNSGVLDSIFCINNFMNGGYAGFNVYGGSGYGAGQYGTNFIIDSNVMTNIYYYGTNIYYATFISCSYNTITSRTTNGSSWFGLGMYYCNGPFIIGNRIIQRNFVSYPWGILFQHGSYMPQTQNKTLIANNEIIARKNSTNAGHYGLNISGSNADIINNSLYLSVSSSSLPYSGIYVNSRTPNEITIIKNNNIVLTSTLGHPVYIDGTGLNYSNYDIDYNNLYAPKFVGYAEGDIRTIEAWQQRFPSDRHSIRILPDFVDVTGNLALSNYNPLLNCYLIPAVSTDVKYLNRLPMTTMGCYEQNTPKTGDGALVKIIGLKDGKIAGSNDSIYAVVLNAGTTSINSVNIGWSVNGTSQGSKTVSPSSLTTGDMDTLFVGILTYSSGENNVQVWINNINGSSTTDAIRTNDTVKSSSIACPNALGSVINVSKTGTYTSIKQVIDLLSVCGLSSDVTMILDKGIYEEDVDITNINISGNYSLTLTSTTGNPTDVIIRPVSGIGILVANSNNIKIKNITIDVMQGERGIELGTSSNIIIDNCIILLDSSTATNTSLYTGIYKSGAGLTGLTVKNCNIQGGYSGIYLYGTSANYYQNIIIDSNIITRQYHSGAYFYYVDLNSMSCNLITPRSSNTGTWYGLYFNYVRNGSIIGNRIRSSTNINNLYGFSFNYPTNILVANNEVYISGSSSSSSNRYGIYTNYTNALKCLHNSILLSGGTSSGIAPANIYVSTSASYPLSTYRNNNFVRIGGTSGYAVRLSAAPGTTFAQYNDIDYNNYYTSGTNLGYAGSAKATLALWQAAVPTDIHSVNIQTVFANPANSLELANDASNAGLTCPYYPGVEKDINENFRLSTTTMGAYNMDMSNAVFDLRLQKIICNDTTVVYPNTVPVKVEISNTGSSTDINSATFGWSINGELQSPYTWTTSNPLTPGNNIEISVGTFSVDKTSSFDIVVWIERVNGSKDSIAWNDTASRSVNVFWTDNNLVLQSIEPLVAAGSLCTDDYVPFKIKVENTGKSDYNFAANPTTFSIRVTRPAAYSLDTVISTGIIKSGETAILTLTDTFPIVTAGQYDIRVWIDSVNHIVYDDSLVWDYISGKFGLPIDADFSSEIPMVFMSEGTNPAHKWELVSQGTGADSVVKPQFGTGMLSFGGDFGDMTTLSTRQLDLSRTVQPSLTFWYFHDTIPCDDYTDVRVTIDGGITYNTLFSLTKYDAVHGWRQYSMDLPPYVINECVTLLFEAMEKSYSGDVTQYIDRIRILAKQDIAVAEILIPEYDVCDLKNKVLKVVLSNLTAPVLDYVSTPVIVTLEVKETGEVFVDTLNSNSLSGSSSDTITLATGFDFGKGTYTFKAYFSSLLDVDRDNDTLETSLTVNTELNVQLNRLSGNNTCLQGEMPIYQEITLTNTGNMDLFDIDLILQIDTGETGSPAYFRFTERCTDTIHADSSFTYIFKNVYAVPWVADYYPRVYAYLACDSALVNATTAIVECVNMKDLYIVSIDNPTTGNDTIEKTVYVTASVRNRDDLSEFTNAKISVLIRNSQGIQTETFTETISKIGILSTESHTFTHPYTIPDDSVYYLTVYTDSYDMYGSNDTLTVKRTTLIDSTDLSVVNIDNPVMVNDTIGEVIHVTASLYNSSKYKDFAAVNITVRVTNSQGVETETFTEIVGNIGALSRVSHIFSRSYTVPNDSVYYLSVYIESYDKYSHNDTLILTRNTVTKKDVGITPTGTINAFTLGQNIPNPATNSTRIDYSVPEAGEVMFHVHSISGQLLYSQTIEASHGTHSLELNTSAFAAGVYFYSMEYKGQRLVRQLIIK